MKKVFLVALMLVGITTFAQVKKEGKVKREKLTTEQRVDKRVESLKTDLALNDQQVTEVKALMTKEAAKRDSRRADLKAQKDADRSVLKADMAKEQEATKAEMKKILNAEQYDKWDKKREENKSKMMEKLKERKAKRDEMKDK